MKKFIFLTITAVSLAGCTQPAKRVAKVPPVSHSYTVEQLKTVSDDALCRDIALYPTTEAIRAEKNRRKLDCTAVTTALVQSGQTGYLANPKSANNTGPSFWEGIGQSMVLMNAVNSQQRANTPPPAAPPMNVSASSIMIVPPTFSITRKITAGVIFEAKSGCQTSSDRTSSKVVLPHRFSGEWISSFGAMFEALKQYEKIVQRAKVSG